MAEINSETRILAAAEEIFIRDGFDGARMQTIADTAGINKALLHYYFRSKQNLFEQVLYARIGSFLPQISQLFNSDIPFAQKIQAFVESYIRTLTENPQLPMFILFSIHRNPDFVKRLPGDFFNRIAAFVQQEIDSGKMCKTDPAHFLISLISMCVFPFLARHLAGHMMAKDANAYAVFLAERKAQIMHFVNAMMIT